MDMKTDKSDVAVNMTEDVLKSIRKIPQTKVI